jgi:hypothetical protein
MCDPVLDQIQILLIEYHTLSARLLRNRREVAELEQLIQELELLQREQQQARNRQ